MTSLATQHRAAAALHEQFPDAQLYITAGHNGLNVQVCKDGNGTPAERLVLLEAVRKATGCLPTVVGLNGQLIAYAGRYEGAHVDTVYGPDLASEVAA